MKMLHCLHRVESCLIFPYKTNVANFSASLFRKLHYKFTSHSYNTLVRIAKMQKVQCVILAFCGALLVHYVICQLDGYIPGQDYPIYSEIPAGLSFRCEQNRAGYYSDPEAQCQVWHWCLPNGQKFSFLCPNGTVFNQIARVCDWWFNVDCASTPNYYGINEDLYIVPPPYNRRRD